MKKVLNYGFCVSEVCKVNDENIGDNMICKSLSFVVFLYFYIRFKYVFLNFVY